jgi:phosphoglycolate phosphatase
MYDAVLFDNDGVLVELMDIEDIYGAVEKTFVEFGASPTREEVERLVGCDADAVVDVCGRHGIDPEGFWERRDANVSRVQRAAVDAGEKSPYDDFDAVERLASEHSVGVVSNNQQATVDHIVESFEMSFFDVQYGREPTVESLRRKKPSPHYVESALDSLGATDAVYVGDSPHDVVAADRAGVDSAFVRRGHRRETTLDATPTYEVGSLHELEGVIDGRLPG